MSVFCKGVPTACVQFLFSMLRGASGLPFGKKKWKSGLNVKYPGFERWQQNEISSECPVANTVRQQTPPVGGTSRLLPLPASAPAHGRAWPARGLARTAASTGSFSVHSPPSPRSAPAWGRGAALATTQRG